MSSSAPPRSSTSATSSRIATPAYLSCLASNGVDFVSYLIPESIDWFTSANESSWKDLVSSRTRVTVLHDKYQAALRDRHDILFAQDGQEDDQLVSYAARLVDMVSTFATARKIGEWSRFLQFELFYHYDFYKLFSTSENARWTYDPWPEASARGRLVDPRPDSAFGIRMGSIFTTEYEMAEQLPELTYPHVSPFCDPSNYFLIAFPFLIWEFGDLQGNFLSCNNAMANALIKALDVIASVQLQQQLCVIGVSQVRWRYEVYLSFSADDDSRAGRPRKYSIHLLATGDLRALDDMMRLLRLLEAARTYGRHTFRDHIWARLAEMGSPSGFPFFQSHT